MSAIAKEPQPTGAFGEVLVVPGTILGGKYEVDEIIGEGGMGIIARATNIDLHTTVAVKILQPKLVHDEIALARFLQEARGVSKLRSPHIVQMLDVNSHPPEPPFMVMELLSGEDLDSMVVRRGKLPAKYVIELVLQACAGVSVAHAARILHRDLKPANLFLSRQDNGSCILKVLDFGLMKAAPSADVKLTQPNDIFGSPSFMSPEQISGETLDERTDIWALGAILFELVTGVPAFGAETIPQTLVNIATREPPAVSSLVDDVPLALEAIIGRCLAKERTARFRNVAELCAVLEPLRSPVDLPALLSGAPLTRSAAPLGDPAATLDEPLARERETTEVRVRRKPARLRGVLVLALFGAIVGGVIGLVVYSSKSDRSDEPVAKNVSTSASVATSAPSSVPPVAETALGSNVSDLPSAPVATARNNVVAQRPAPSVAGLASSPPSSPASSAPVSSPAPVLVAPPTEPRPPPAAHSTDPYPEFGRRK